jgi:hypothetical protein
MRTHRTTPLSFYVAARWSLRSWLSTAGRQMRDFSWQGQPMASISVDGTVGSFVVLPTHDVPHLDVVLAEASSEEAARLLVVFGPAMNNPYKRRRR